MSTRYPGNAVRSPISDSVAERLRAIAKNDTGRKADVFMKVGDSHSVSRNFLHCFAGSIELGTNQALLPTLEFFKKGEAAGTTPFDRTSRATLSGMSANWPLAGNPTPLAQEIAAINPRFAFVAFGTNDMQFGASFASAALGFYRNLSALSAELERAGIVPILTGLLPRRDSTAAAQWVASYDALSRGIAEQRQVPYLDLYLATRDLPKHGLMRDGIHANVFKNSGPQPCNFSDAGLGYGYSVRNLESLRALDAVKRVVVDGAPPPDTAVPPVSGDGSASTPFVIDALPFTHSSETGSARQYELSVTQATPIRAMLFNRDERAGLSLVSAGSRGDDRIIERTLVAGKHRFVVAGAGSGSYLLVVVRCDPADGACK